MTVSTTVLSVTYDGSGSVGPYPFSFPISEVAALQVTQTDALGNVTYPTYTPTPVNNDYANGGSITLNTACPVGSTLTIRRLTPLVQESEFTENMPTLYKTFERNLDKIIEIQQEQQDQIESLSPPLPADINLFFTIEDYSNSFSLAVASIGATPATLLIDIPCIVSANISTPSNLYLMFINSGALAPATTKTVTVSSPEHILASPTQQIFSGSGSVVFAVAGTVYPQWWGAKGDGSTNDTAAIEAARASLPITGGESADDQATVVLNPGTYVVTPGGIGAFLCSLYGPDAVLKAASDTSGGVLTVSHRQRFGRLILRGIMGSHCTKLSHQSPTIDSNTIGLYVTDSDSTKVQIQMIIGYQTAIYLYAYPSATDKPCSSMDFDIDRIEWNTFGIVIRSGVGADTGRCEANRFRISYIQGCDYHIYLDAYTNGSYVSGNEFIINVMELVNATDPHGFYMYGSKCEDNRLIVTNALVPPLAGDYSVITLGAGVVDNYFRLPWIAWDHVDQGAGSYSIFDLQTAQFSYPGVAGISRSVICGSAAPTAGLWRQGDVCWNNAPAAGGTMGWVCVTSGTPGTWKAMPNLVS